MSYPRLNDLLGKDEHATVEVTFAERWRPSLGRNDRYLVGLRVIDGALEEVAEYTWDDDSLDEEIEAEAMRYVEDLIARVPAYANETYCLIYPEETT